jgi:3-hydroxybutyryl-CoA dehydrogenase
MLARSEESAERAENRTKKLIERMEASGTVRVSTDRDAAAEATIVVEAIVEDHEAKCELITDLGRRLPDEVILGTTTSSLSVSALAEASGRADRFVGLHVFNPVPRMELIELVFANGVLPDVQERLRNLCRDLGKTAVEVPDTPGFVVNRLLFPYLFDAVRLMEQTGLSAADVDRCMTLGTGHPMGPLALLDFVGLDVSKAIGEAIGAEVPASLNKLVDEGALGKKTGRGLYDYAES